MSDAPSVKAHKARLVADPEYAKWYSQQMAENAASDARMAAKKASEQKKFGLESKSLNKFVAKNDIKTPSIKTKRQVPKGVMGSSVAKWLLAGGAAAGAAAYYNKTSKEN